MAPRTRSSPVQKASWRGRGGPVSSSLLFYRRLVMTTLSVALLAGFALLIWLNWTANPAPLAASLHLSDYSRGSAPPLAFADRDAQALQSLLADRFTTVVALGANQAADAENLVRAFEFDERPFTSASPKATLLVYVAAHGCSETVDSGAADDEDKAFLLPVDFDPGDPAKAGLPVGELLAAVARQRPKNKVLAIDFGSIEHDLRLGTAVNRFSDVLVRELNAIKLKGDERLVVITSHRTWERSFVVPGEPADKARSVFGFIFGAALGEPGHEEEHADLTRYDGGRPDKRISVAELAWFVQRQVSDWVWINTDFQRTQQPLVLVKRGANPAVRLELAGLGPDQQPAQGSEEAKELAALAEIHLCRAPAKPAADPNAEKKGDQPATGETTANEPHRESYASRSPLAVALFAQAPKAEAPPAEAAPPGASAPAAAAPPAATPPAAPPPAIKVEDLRPAWLREQADELRPLFALDANPWLPVPQVRAQVASLLDQQQRRLAGLAPRDDSASSRARGLSPLSADWPPKMLAGIDTSVWVKAVRSRNAILLQLQHLAEGAERLEGESGRRAREKLRALVAALESIIGLVDRNVLVQSKASTPMTLYLPLVTSIEQTDVTSLAQPLKELEAAYQELLAELGAALPSGGPSDTAVAWLNAWESGQSLPLALVDLKSDLSIKPPALAVQPPLKAGERPAREPPQGAGQDGVPDKIAARRQSWLAIQVRIANQLDSTEPPIDMPPANAGANADRQLNRTALAIRRRHESAAQALAAFDGTRSQRAGEHWKADRTARLALVLSGEPAALPYPPEKLVPGPAKVLLGIAPVRVAASEEGADHVAELSLGRPLAAEWQIDADGPDVLNRVLVEITYRPADFVVADRQGRSVPPFQPGATLRLADLIDGNLLTLQVTAQREVGVEEARQADANRKELSVRLRLDEQSVSAPVTFRLPDSRYLDVLVAGHRATLERGNDEPGESLPEGWAWRRALPDDAASRRGREGDFRLEVSPFPRGQSHFRLKLVNRAQKTRKLVATWHVTKAGAATITDWLKWQQAIDEATLLKIRAPAADSKQLAAGDPWEPPLFVPPAAAAAAGAPAAPPAPLPEVLNIESGLLCVLTDELEPGWQQRIWLRARPLHPQEYLEMSARFRPAPPTDAVVVSLNSTSAIRSQLPPAELEVKWFELADDRIQPPPPAPRDFSLAADQPPITAEIAPDVRLASSSLLRAIVEIDGYPRAAHFPAIPRIGEPAVHRRESYVQLQLFEETAPAAGAAPPAGPPPPPRPLAQRESFNRVPRLGYAVYSDFADRRGQSLRLTQNGNVGSALARFPLDRRFVVKCRKPADPLGPQLALDCEVHEWAGSLGSDIRWLRPGKNVIRAEIVEPVAGQEQPLDLPEARDEYVIVLDTAGPQITSQMPAKFERFVGEKVAISFSVSDSEPGKEDETSGVEIGQIMWGTAVDNKAVAIVAPQPVAALLDPASIKPGQQAFRCELAEATKEPGPLKIYIQATDRAGNPGRPVAICEIDVRKPRTLDNRGGAGKPAVGK